MVGRSWIEQNSATRTSPLRNEGRVCIFGKGGVWLDGKQNRSLDIYFLQVAISVGKALHEASQIIHDLGQR
jgi:hypothetical protein